MSSKSPSLSGACAKAGAQAKNPAATAVKNANLDFITGSPVLTRRRCLRGAVREGPPSSFLLRLGALPQVAADRWRDRAGHPRLCASKDGVIGKVIIVVAPKSACREAQ